MRMLNPQKADVDVDINADFNPTANLNPDGSYLLPPPPQKCFIYVTSYSYPICCIVSSLTFEQHGSSGTREENWGGF